MKNENNKRDGTIVEYNPEKIKNAIKKPITTLVGKKKQPMKRLKK